MKAMLLCCAVLLVSCSKPGDFCQVVRKEKDFAPETSEQMLRTDRDEVVAIATENEYWGRHCD